MASIQAELYLFRPNMEIEVTELPNQEILDYGAERDASVKIVSQLYVDAVPLYEPVQAVEADLLPFMQVRYDCFVHKKNPLCQLRQIPLKAFFSQQIARFTNDATMFETLLRYAACSPGQIQTIACSSSAALCEFVANNLCVALNPFHAQRHSFQARDCKNIPFREDIYNIFSIYLPSAARTRDMQTFISLLRTEFSDF